MQDHDDWLTVGIFVSSTFERTRLFGLAPGGSRPPPLSVGGLPTRGQPRHDRGCLGRREAFLCMHGEPTWGYLDRNIIPRLAEFGRVVGDDGWSGLAGRGGSDDDLHRIAGVERGSHRLVGVVDVEVVGDDAVKGNTLVVLGQHLERRVVAASVLPGHPDECQVAPEQTGGVQVDRAEIDERPHLEQGAAIPKQAHGRAEARRMSGRIDDDIDALGDEPANRRAQLGRVFRSHDAVGRSQIGGDVEPWPASSNRMLPVFTSRWMIP